MLEASGLVGKFLRLGRKSKERGNYYYVVTQEYDEGTYWRPQDDALIHKLQIGGQVPRHLLTKSVGRIVARLLESISDDLPWLLVLSK